MKRKGRQMQKGKNRQSLWQKIRFLPVLVLVAFLSLGVRINDFVQDVQTVRLTPPVQAEEPLTADTTADATPTEDAPVTEAPVVPQIMPSALDTDIEFSEERIQIFSELADRREELNQRERRLDQREALLKAAEVQFDMKLQELEGVRAEIESLLQQQSEEEEARIASLVKIYEGMKAKDAARIFNTLEMPVLLAVVGRMSERKSAPVLAAMDAERARQLTILLVEQKQLPQIPEDQ